MVQSQNLTNRESYQAWLNTRPIQDAQMIACRVALRVLPLALAVTVPARLVSWGPQDYFLDCFRASFVTWAANKYPSYHVEVAASAAASRLGTRMTKSTHLTDAIVAAAYAAAADKPSEAAAYAGINPAYYAVTAIGRASAAAADAVGISVGSHVWIRARRDAEWLETNRQERLINQPLWLENVREGGPCEIEIPPWARSALDSLASIDIAFSQDFEPWMRWYRAVIPGNNDLLPRDIFGKALTVMIARQSDEWWERPAAEVNADIAAWLEESESAPDSDRILKTTLESLSEQTPAAFRFVWQDDRIKAQPPDPAPSSSKVAQDLLDETRRKARELSENLRQLNADPYAYRSVCGLKDILPEAVDHLRAGLLLSRARSVETVASAYGSLDEERELFPGAIAQILDLSETVRDLQACLPEIREVEAERLALEIDPGNVDAVSERLDTIVQNAVVDEEVVDESAKEALRSMTSDAEQSAPTKVRQRLIADRALVVRNFVSQLYRRAIESHLAAETSDTTKEIWDKSRSKFVEGASDGLGSMGRPVAVVGVSALVWSVLGPTAGIAVMLAGFGKLDQLGKLLAKRFQVDESGEDGRAQDDGR